MSGRDTGPVFAGLESGGTTWECAVGTGPDDLLAETSIPTTSPAETIGRAVAFLEAAGPVDAVGIGSFGPVDLRPASPTWGFVTTTPKPGWANTDVAQEIRRRVGVPVAFDTDVNAAALGEHRWGAGRGLDTLCYVTVGTGIGGGAIAGGRLVHGLVHPELGHLRIPHDRDADPFPGACPFHGDCWEGLASGRALEARWGRPAHELGDDPEIWDLEAGYLALGLLAVVCVLSPERIVAGGGVMRREGLLERVGERLVGLLGGYLDVGDPTAFLVPPALGSRSGVLGAIALAAAAYEGAPSTSRT